MIKVKAKERGDGCDVEIKVFGKNEVIAREVMTVLTKLPEVLSQRAPEAFELMTEAFRKHLVDIGALEDEAEEGSDA